ncbi:RNA methyltransferase [Brevundimonas sp. NIBR10]|uniref:TrmH family RNA methyltransferase n=1 Tax=Brevundimonas sp. NIBR10 TaxID=3015997 RepID=UPI0022F15C5E|nr:RNA methyltransferase [Brevundimonas sp. NIBR10]
MDPIRIDDPDDPRITAYRDIKERDLTGREGLFIAEGEVVVRTLASSASRCRMRSMLLAEKRVAGLSDLITGLPVETPVYVVGQAVLDVVAGFPLHRGILALGEKPPVLTIAEALSGLPEETVVVAASAIGNHDNIGGLYRNAAAFGAGAVLLDDLCGDPFYRKAIRVSVGAVLRTARIEPLPVDALVDALIASGFEVIALTPGGGETLASLTPGGRRAILLGSEGPGLPQAVIDRCRAVRIPMSGGFDSLNVAVTSAVALHQLTALAD